ncbi:hypothetical protein Q8W71_10220 [Methylobacterium sp. NEAU 140]|uniref:hypothetical protein n=1 Tax=Methylobacterium sp. NEAU 140 TaxID=3064945 RepID=UPI002733E77E|nr:hypothetical protein [Methylobacterium sp. NEAU 140]MDP4022999.1 hypothetical protein [Methylobacterium sp. NEAU 140]
MRAHLFPAALAAVVIAAPCLAAGPNGGATVVADGHPVEFVATDAGLTFFLTGEDGKPVDTAGLTAKAFVTAGGRTETLVLKPAAPNRLAADLKAPLPPGAKVVLSTRVHGHTLQARFER